MVKLAELRKNDYEYQYLFSDDVIRDSLYNAFEDFICEYISSTGYIVDVISEVADSNTPVYYNDLYRSVPDLDYYGKYFDVVVQEGLYSVSDRNFSLCKLLGVGFCYMLEEHLNLNLKKLLFNYSLAFFAHCGVKEVPEDFEQKLEDFIEFFDGETFLLLHEELEELIKEEKII